MREVFIKNIANAILFSLVIFFSSSNLYATEKGFCVSPENLSFYYERALRHIDNGNYVDAMGGLVFVLYTIEEGNSTINIKDPTLLSRVSKALTELRSIVLDNYNYAIRNRPHKKTSDNRNYSSKGDMKPLFDLPRKLQFRP